ncbi:hypothetical protein M409DRAFT_52091 [Zasmidium cellare ATCC 36951]|uniref:Uncharacterized protein n=1 Tax=Zasmidium cellare ATCC 36951 TaxID=1080233 RepID=A0A6A6CVM3_ZASCE|nr:uncharacterized protein M409DRAFT_52091 [Zasmidium cellare ATCC 36951]KAF2169556.1 hypothetical protein M409DRAFT_52091 [Zasmidium cellare ATCC 36951]
MRSSMILPASYLLLTHSSWARPTNEVQQVYSGSHDFDSNHENGKAFSSGDLYGWVGCSVNDRSRILEAMHDSRDILDTHRVRNFADWRQTPVAIQLFGQAVANDYHGWSSRVQQNFRSAHEFAAGTHSERVQVFCHDQSMEGPLKDECASSRQPDPVVVARNYLGGDGPALMLCDKWFQMQSMTSAAENRGTSATDLDTAENQARAFITALMLIPSIAPWPQDHHGPSMIYRKVVLAALFPPKVMANSHRSNCFLATLSSDMLLPPLRAKSWRPSKMPISEGPSRTRTRTRGMLLQPTSGTARGAGSSVMIDRRNSRSKPGGSWGL